MSLPVKSVGVVLNDPSRPLKERFRALFTLRNLGGEEAIREMSKAFSDGSALLKHEVAYCLGQMGNAAAVPVLEGILRDASRETIVRHEAGEALGAIGDPALLPLLKQFTLDPVREVAETCQLAVERIEYHQKGTEENLSKNPYCSVDPAPPLREDNVTELRRILLDEQLSLFMRYRAMFTLRNKGDKESILALAEGLLCSDVLFRHEIAYVLGQIQSEFAKEQLLERLRDPAENDMVRHECAEALGSIATDDINKELEKYLGEDQPAVLRESCIIALDFSDYNQSGEFQYANTLSA